MKEKIVHEKELLIKDTAIATSSNAVVLTGLDGNITYANDMFYKILHLPDDEEAAGRSVFSLLNISGAGDILDQIIDMKNWFAEIAAVRGDSKEFHVLMSAALITSSEGENIGITFSIADITMRKSAEAALKESRESLKQRNETMEKDLMIAQLVQRELISMKVPESEFLSIDFRYLPVEKVGGDFFSFLQTREDSMGIFIGDVTGHGVAAALFHSLIKSATEKISRNFSNNPSEYIFKLNNELAGRMTSYFITAVYGIFERVPGSSDVSFRFASGGHPSPVVIRKNGTAGFFGTGGTVIGLAKDFQFEEMSVTLSPGDRLFLYTDGLTETENAAKEMIGYDEKLGALLNEVRRDTMGGTLDAAVEALDAFRGTIPFSDDILIIGIEVKG